MNKELPIRKKNRWEYHDYSSGGIYFLTVCTAGRQCIFWDIEKTLETLNTASDIIPSMIHLSPYGTIAEKAINNIPDIYPYISIAEYVVMPDHIHIMLSMEGDSIPKTTISQVINQMKDSISKETGASIWQKSFFDHVIRNRKDFDKHMQYIIENPIRWIQR